MKVYVINEKTGKKSLYFTMYKGGFRVILRLIKKNIKSC